MALTKFRLLTTAGEISAQADLQEQPLDVAASHWMSLAMPVFIDSRGRAISVRGSAIVAIVDGWG